MWICWRGDWHERSKEVRRGVWMCFCWVLSVLHYPQISKTLVNQHPLTHCITASMDPLSKRRNTHMFIHTIQYNCMTAIKHTYTQCIHTYTQYWCNRREWKKRSIDEPFQTQANVTPILCELHKKPRLVFLAKRDISVGEELVYDYGERKRSVVEANSWLRKWQLPIHNYCCAT